MSLDVYVGACVPHPSPSSSLLARWSERFLRWIFPSSPSSSSTFLHEGEWGYRKSAPNALSFPFSLSFPPSLPSSLPLSPHYSLQLHHSRQVL